MGAAGPDVQLGLGGQGHAGGGLGVAPGGGEAGFVIAALIQRQPQLTQILAGELPGPLQHQRQCRQGIAVIAHEGAEPFQVILGAFGIAGSASAFVNILILKLILKAHDLLD